MTDSTNRSRALRVFLQHSLSCSISLARKFKQEYSDQDKRTTAAEVWVHCIEQALSVAGVFGLCAVDRAEECLHLSIRDASHFDDYFEEHLQLKSAIVELSATCYERALIHQKLGRVELLSLWVYIGHCSDCILALDLEMTPVDRRWTAYPAPVHCNSNKRWRSAWEKKRAAISTNNYRAAQLFSLACELFSGAAAYGCLDCLFASYPMMFSFNKEARGAILRAETNANDAGNCLLLAAKLCVEETTVSDGADLGRLQELTVAGFKRAADMLAPWGPAPQPRNGRHVAKCAEASGRTGHRTGSGHGEVAGMAVDYRHSSAGEGGAGAVGCSDGAGHSLTTYSSSSPRSPRANRATMNARARNIWPGARRWIGIAARPTLSSPTAGVGQPSTCSTPSTLLPPSPQPQQSRMRIHRSRKLMYFSERPRCLQGYARGGCS